MEDEGVSLTQHAAHDVKAALRVFGTDVLSARPIADSDEPDAIGIKLFRLIFADQIRQDGLQEQLAALARDPDGQAVQDALDDLISDVLEDDPASAEAVLETLTEFYRRQAQAGSVQAMADLGNLLYWEDDLDGARAAYQQAIDAGRHEALIDMAYLHRSAGDDDAARACLDEAMSFGDPSLTAQALVTLGVVLERTDLAGAESALLRAVETGDADWAPRAMADLGGLRRHRGDESGARAAYQQAIGTGHAECSAEAGVYLAHMLEELGDLAGAREHYQRVIETGHEHWGPDALESLIQLLQDCGDLDRLRVLHCRRRSIPAISHALGSKPSATACQNSRTT